MYDPTCLKHLLFSSNLRDDKVKECIGLASKSESELNNETLLPSDLILRYVVQNPGQGRKKSVSISYGFKSLG